MGCKVHVMSVGTSALRNFQRTLTDKERVAQALTKLERGELTIKDLEKVLSSEGMTLKDLIEEMLKFVKQYPVQASAELNAFTKKVKEVGIPEKVVLLCSDTEAGELSCEVLRRYFEGEGIDASAYVINGLGKGQFYEGLVNLMCAYKKILDKEVGEGESVCVNPTGGFKPESAVTYLLALSDPRTADIYYIHEAFRDVVSLPVIPFQPLKSVLASARWLEEPLNNLKKCLEGASINPWRPLRITEYLT